MSIRMRQQVFVITNFVHHPHLDDVEKNNSSFTEFIENKNKECDNLKDDLNQYVQSVNQSFSQLKIGIRTNYSLFNQTLTNLNSYQINDLLNSMIKLTEYKQSIKRSFLNRLKHQFILLIITEAIQRIIQRLSIIQLIGSSKNLVLYQHNIFTIYLHQIFQYKFNQGVLQYKFLIQNTFQFKIYILISTSNHPAHLSFNECFKSESD